MLSQSIREYSGGALAGVVDALCEARFVLHVQSMTSKSKRLFHDSGYTL